MADWFDKIPKVELHLHLEGAIPHAALWSLVQKYGGDSSTPDFAALQSRFEYSNFPHFLETWAWKNEFLREYEDFEFIAEAVAHSLAAQNIRYAEAFYSPPDFFDQGLQTQPLTEAIRRGLNRVPGIRVRLIADLVRNYGPKRATKTLMEVQEVRDQDVIGIGLGGAEHDYPPQLFRDVFEQARKLGFHTTAHAGEAAGADSVRCAISDLQVERVGHGVRAIEDRELVDSLIASGLSLEMCPLSNIRTGVVASIHEHPIREFFNRGVHVTVSTDDPEMFSNSLAGEFRLLTDELGFGQTDIQQILLNGVSASWLDEPEKTALETVLVESPEWV